MPEPEKKESAFERINRSIGQAREMVGKMPDIYVWKGPGPEPDKWTAADGTIVYSSYEAYCMD